MIDLELHSHTHHSRDSLNKLADIITACRNVHIDRIAITDHNQIAGALRAHERSPELVIVGEEVKTTQGELLCFFIRELIPRGVTPEEAIQRVHDQGGIVGAPHPLDPRRAGLGQDNITRLGDSLDFIEVFNARTLEAGNNTAADELATRLGLARTVGSDAHLLREIGACRVRMRDYNSPQDFLAALREPATALITRASSPLVHVGSSLARTAHQLGFDRERKD